MTPPPAHAANAGLSLADDVTIIHGDGKLITKAEEIENFKSDGSSRFRTYTRVTSTDANFSGNRFIHLRPLRETPF